MGRRGLSSIVLQPMLSELLRESFSLCLLQLSSEVDGGHKKKQP